MRTRKVNRYWCDFCNKGGLSASHMRKHEASCTLNPQRVCRMCAFTETEQRPLPYLIDGLPLIARGDLYDGEGATYDRDALQPLLPLLRSRTDCPVCIMAALRQRGIPVNEIDGFKFKDECAQIFRDHNEAKYADEHHY